MTASSDGARFEALASEVWVPLNRYVARRVDADDVDDVVADVLLVLWRRLADVPPDRALPWCFGVARRCAANARRGQQRRLRLLQRLADEPVPARAPVGDPALAQALAGLRVADRELLELWAYEGMEPRDLAVVLGCSAGAAASRLSRARAALGRRLRQDGGPAGHDQDVREGAR